MCREARARTDRIQTRRETAAGNGILDTIASAPRERGCRIAVRLISARGLAPLAEAEELRIVKRAHKSNF